MRHDTRTDEYVYLVTYLIDGVTTDGTPFHAWPALAIPPDPFAARNRTAVTDRALEVKLLRALQLTGGKTITREDLEALDRKGLLGP